MLPKSYDKRFKRFMNLKYLKFMTLNNMKYMIDKNVFNFKDLKSFKIVEANKLNEESKDCIFKDCILNNNVVTIERFKVTKEMENGNTFIR